MAIPKLRVKCGMVDCSKHPLHAKGERYKQVPCQRARLSVEIPRFGRPDMFYKDPECFNYCRKKGCRGCAELKRADHETRVQVELDAIRNHAIQCPEAAELYISEHREAETDGD